MKVKITQTSKTMIGTSAELKTHFWITLQDLLYGIMLPSGNDAAYSIAEYMGYIISKDSKDFFQQRQLDLTKQSTTLYVQQFIKAMNERANQLRLSNTWFSNPHGLPNALNTSSAKDIIKLSRYSVKNKLFKQIMNSPTYQYALYQHQHPSSKTIIGSWKNTNKMLERGWQGIKTGFTASAGSLYSCSKFAGLIGSLHGYIDYIQLVSEQSLQEIKENNNNEIEIELDRDNKYPLQN